MSLIEEGQLDRDFGNRGFHISTFVLEVSLTSLAQTNDSTKMRGNPNKSRQYDRSPNIPIATSLPVRFLVLYDLSNSTPSILCC